MQRSLRKNKTTKAGVRAWFFQIYAVISELCSQKQSRCRAADAGRFRLNEVRKSLKTNVFRQNMVDLRGIEPLSEDALMKVSPSAAYIFKFPLANAHRRAFAVGSFIL